MNHGRTDDASRFGPMAANFASGVGSCVGIVEPFKYILRVTPYPQFLALELRVPMGVCSGQYGRFQISMQPYNLQNMNQVGLVHV